MDARNAMYRINHISWWKEELPNDEEYEIAFRNLENNGWKVDYIITHCCPTSVADILGGGMYQPDRLTGFFETIKERCDFNSWIFGHYHDNRTVMRKYTLLYEQIIHLEY